MNTKTRQGTRAVWAGEEEYLLGATQVPVVLSAAFGYRDMADWRFMLKENSLDAVWRLIPHLRFAHAAGNLGAVETIVAPPATSSHMECTPEERARLGIPEGLIRYSTGIEDVEDLIEDLAAALARL
jgi:cystathionine beta-lyase/cystathionine gamma-synthase